MVFKVPASKASIKQNQFEFEIEREGKKPKRYSVPKMQYISSDLRDRMQRASIPLQGVNVGDEVDPEVMIALSTVQRELFDRYAPGLYEIATDDQLQEIQRAWQEESNITAGESSPSAD